MELEIDKEYCATEEVEADVEVDVTEELGVKL